MLSKVKVLVTQSCLTMRLCVFPTQGSHLDLLHCRLVLKNLSGKAGRHKKTWVWSLGQEYPLEEGVTTHFSILAWRIPWTEERGGLQSMESQRIGHDCWSDLVHMHALEEGRSLYSAHIYKFLPPECQICNIRVMGLYHNNNCFIWLKDWEFKQHLNYLLSCATWVP